MTHPDFRDQFLDYIENVLPQDERARFEQELTSNEALRKDFEEYKALLGDEQQIGAEIFQVRSGFTDDVMSGVKAREIGFFRRLYMEMTMNKRVAYAALASAAMVALIVRLGVNNPNITIQGPLPSPKIEKNETEVKSADQLAHESMAAAVKGKSFSKPGVVEKKDAEKKDSAPQKFSPTEKTLSEPAVGAIPFNMRREAPPPFEQPITQVAPMVDGRIGMRDRSMGLGAGESYINNPSSPVIAVQQESLSTFSIDVDTASYTNARRYLSAWTLPPEAAIRTEEFVNYFDYNYPEQFEHPFAVHTEVAPSPLTNGSYLMKIGVRAKDVKDSNKPWNLVFLVDVSGSMADANKLPLVKQALKTLTDKMRSHDRIALVTYAGNAGLQLESTPGSEKAKIHHAIDALTSGGSTNGASGIQIAYETAMRSKIEGGVNRVILATDGDFNVGVTSRQELIRMIEEKRKLGVSLTSIGVGQGNLNDATLEQLANKGNGNYFYLDSPKEADRVFSEKLAGTIETVAKDVKIQVEFNPQQVVQYKLVGYENRTLAKQDFNNDTVDAGEIGSGHTVTALYEVVLANTPAATTAHIDMRYQATPAQPTIAVGDAVKSEMAFIKVRFKEPDGDTSKLLEFPFKRSEVKGDLSAASSDLRFAAAVAGFAEILKHSQLGNSLTLKQVAALAEANKGEDKAGQRQEFINLVRQAAAVLKQGI